MRYVYEVYENIYGYHENEKLWDSLEKAKVDFNERIIRLTSELRMISVDSIEIDEIDLLARLGHYPVQVEVEDEPLWTDEAKVKIWIRELN